MTRRAASPGSRRAWVPAVALLLLSLAGCAVRPAGSAHAEGSPGAHAVVLISLDGFWAGYLEQHQPPTLTALAAAGVRSEGMIPAFPGYTFPNHYTIATGLHPESHGIVHNTMYDPVFDAVFSLRGPGPREGRWWGGEPIWVTAEKQGVRAAAFFWPGTEAEIGGVRPSRWMPYNSSVPYDVRVDSVITWLSLPAGERPRMITLYFEEPDHTGHRDGPHAASIRGAVLRADSAIARLVAGLEERGLGDSVNLVIVSDHGMAEVSGERVVFLADVLDTASVEIVTLSPVLTGWSRTGDNAALVAALRRLPHVSAWLREDVPARLRFSRHRRIPPVVALADEGWTIAATRRTVVRSGGAHGYDNTLPSMRALFIAHGPAFRRGVRIGEFPNVDVYPMLARILRLVPAPNDGTLDVLGDALR